jgi:hypothetical protein
MPPLCDSKEAGNLYTLFLTDEILLWIIWEGYETNQQYEHWGRVFESNPWHKSVSACFYVVVRWAERNCDKLTVSKEY